MISTWRISTHKQVEKTTFTLAFVNIQRAFVVPTGTTTPKIKTIVSWMIFPLSRVVENNSFWDMSHNCRKLPGTSYFKFVLCFQNSLKGHQKIQNKEWIYQTRHLAPFCWFATWQCRQLLSRSDSDTVLGKMQAFMSIFINFTSKTSLTNSCVLLLPFHTASQLLRDLIVRHRIKGINC